jgi:ribonucleotide monophosphatase NagD (HAD superfamily)
MRSAVVWDLDGTLSEHNYRVHFAKKKDYGTYYSLMHKDEPIAHSVELVKMYRDKGYALIMITGRPENYRKVTLEWLSNHGIPHDILLMRNNGEFISNAMMKLARYNESVKNHFIVKAAFDDDPKVIQMWEGLGVRTYQLSRTEE